MTMEDFVAGMEKNELWSMHPTSWPEMPNFELRMHVMSPSIILRTYYEYYDISDTFMRIIYWRGSYGDDLCEQLVKSASRPETLTLLNSYRAIHEALKEGR